jgi:prepilin-type N-terminal cleavage/methylation domain-containing protein
MFWNYLALRKTHFYTAARFRQSGFGLIELMVSISIMTIVSSVILVKQSSFNGAVLLRNQTYEIALSAREVQLSALTTGNNRNDFRAVLGIHFDTNAANNGRYMVFQDDDENGFYDSGEEFGVQGFLDNRFEIRSIRSGLTTPSEVSVIFVRPNFDARFFRAPGPTNEINEETIEIDVARRGISGTDDGTLRTLEITATGQITVKNI